MRILTALILSAFLLPIASAQAAVPEDNLAEYGHGIITNYTDLDEGEVIEWIWIAPGVQLSTYRFELGDVENLTLLVDEDMDQILHSGFPKVLQRAGSRDDAAPMLHIDAAVFWAERANRSKWWVPYAGGHLAQAGVGIEMIFRDGAGNVVAKMRHSGREGDELGSATQELVDEIAGFIHAQR